MPDVPTVPEAAEATAVAVAPSFDSLNAHYVDQKAIATSHIITLNALADNFPNAQTLLTIQETATTLKAQRDEMEREIQLLENKSNAANVIFEDKAPEVTGEPRDKVITLQDYILAILVITFAFFFVTVFFYVGKITAWNKKYLSYMVATSIIFITLGYGLLRIYA